MEKMHLPTHQFFGLLVLELHQPALLEVRSHDDVADVLEDQMECHLSLFRSIDISDPVTADPFFQLGPGQLLSVHTVVLQGRLAHVQVVADAQLPAKVGDVLDRLLSELLLSERVASDLILLQEAIDPDENKSATKKEFEIDV